MTFVDALRKHTGSEDIEATYADGDWTILIGQQVVFMGRPPGDGPAAGSELFHAVVRALSRVQEIDRVPMHITDEQYESFLEGDPPEDPEPMAA